MAGKMTIMGILFKPLLVRPNVALGSDFAICNVHGHEFGGLPEAKVTAPDAFRDPEVSSKLAAHMTGRSREGV